MTATHQLCKPQLTEKEHMSVVQELMRKSRPYRTGWQEKIWNIVQLESMTNMIMYVESIFFDNHVAYRGNGLLTDVW